MPGLWCKEEMRMCSWTESGMGQVTLIMHASLGRTYRGSMVLLKSNRCFTVCKYV